MRELVLLLIGLVFGATAGFLAAGGVPSDAHDHGSHDDAHHEQANYADWSGDAPAFTLTALRDESGGIALLIDIQPFAFTPRLADQQAAQNSGHAHVYVDGIKMARAYGPWVHLADVREDAEIRVTLNANDHAHWAIAGTPMTAEITVP